MKVFTIISILFLVMGCQSNQLSPEAGLNEINENIHQFYKDVEEKIITDNESLKSNPYWKQDVLSELKVLTPDDLVYPRVTSIDQVSFACADTQLVSLSIMSFGNRQHIQNLYIKNSKGDGICIPLHASCFVHNALKSSPNVPDVQMKLFANPYWEVILVPHIYKKHYNFLLKGTLNNKLWFSFQNTNAPTRYFTCFVFNNFNTLDAQKPQRSRADDYILTQEKNIHIESVHEGEIPQEVEFATNPPSSE